MGSGLPTMIPVLAEVSGPGTLACAFSLGGLSDVK